MRRMTLVGLGDSITEAIHGAPGASGRWLALLGQQLSGRFPAVHFEVINAGVGGNSDREKMARLEDDVLAHDPDVVLVQFGGNNRDFRRPERLVTPEQTGAFLEELRNHLDECCCMVLITFPRLIDEKHIRYACGEDEAARRRYTETFREFGGTNGHLDAYREVVRTFARNHQYPVVDLYMAMLESNDPDTLTLDDGVHLTRRGNALLAGLVYETVSRILAERGTESHSKTRRKRTSRRPDEPGEH